MAEAQPRVDVDRTKTGTEATLFDAAEPVVPNDADVPTPTLVHGGGGGVVDEQHDRKAKTGKVLETAAVGDNTVERSDSVPVGTGQAIPGGVAEQAEAADWMAGLDPGFQKIFDPAFIIPYICREDVQRDLAAFVESIGGFRNNPEDLDEDPDQFRL